MLLMLLYQPRSFAVTCLMKVNISHLDADEGSSFVGAFFEQTMHLPGETKHKAKLNLRKREK